jgi:hypothetical protein
MLAAALNLWMGQIVQQSYMHTNVVFFYCSNIGDSPIKLENFFFLKNVKHLINA